MKSCIIFFAAFLFTSGIAFSQQILFYDDFEVFSNNWVMEGTWGTTTTQSSSGSQSLTDSPAGNYLSNQNTSATMAQGVDLSNAPNAEMRFVAVYDIEPGNFDFCYLEASGDGGSNWTTLANFLGENNSTPWTEYTYSLNDYLGSSDFKIRFRFNSDGATEFDGIYIDDFQIIELEADETPPGVLHDPPEFYESYIGDVVVTSDLIDDSGIQFAFLKYSVDAGPEQTVPGINVIDETWTFTIPRQNEGAQVDYYFLVRDDSPNENTMTTDTYSYIAGHHVIHDNGQNDDITAIGPGASSGITGCAVRLTLTGTTDVIYALIRNYTDQNSPNNDFQFHIWSDNNGMPGADLITPFSVTPEADLIENSPMTRIDLSNYVAQLSNLTGDVFVGFTVPTGKTHITQTAPAIAQRSFNYDGVNWTENTQSDYHFRVVTTQFDAPDYCVDAADLTSLIGQGAGNAQTSPLWDNSNATVSGNEPGYGYDCWFDDVVDNPLWFKFVGDGATYRIETTDCNGTATNYIQGGDAQIALYSGTDCGNLTAVACSDDGEIEPDIYAPVVEIETTNGLTYFIMVDGFDGSFGEFCVEMTQLVTCADVSIGTATGATSICFNELTSFDVNDVVIPTTSMAGFDWVITTEDISGSPDPYNENSLVDYFGHTNSPFTPVFLNDGNQISTGTYYFTPLVFGAAIDTDGTPSGLDFTNGCIQTGTSIEVILHPEYDELGATPSSVGESYPPGNNGEASVAVTGGSGSYSYDWDNGGNTATVTGLAAGDYTVTVSDVTGCVDELVVIVTVDIVASTNDVAFDHSIQLYPNPAKSRTHILYQFNETSNLKMTLTNTLGQTVNMQTIHNALSGSIEIDLDQLAEGVYFIQLTDGVNQSTKRLVVDK